MARTGSGFGVAAAPRCARVALALALIAGDAPAQSDAAAPAHAAAERLPLEVCRLEGIDEPLLCGVYSVYEDRGAGAGRTIPIRVVVVPARSGNPRNMAWIEHPGGPRYSTVGTAHYYTAGGPYERFREDWDVVLVDVRGLHESGPLYCEALRELRILERYYPVERVAACREELAAGHDLAQYSTFNAIDDYEEIRRWLGYAQWDIGGWSFGGRFMLTYLHRYPQSVRTVSLFVPAILNFERPLDYARFGQQAFDRVAAACRADPACRAAFPTVDEDLDTVLAELAARPRSVEVLDPYSNRRVLKIITRDVLAEEVWIALLDTVTGRTLPYVLHHAARGNFGPFLELAVPESPPAPEPDGHYFSVVCPEETTRLTAERAAAASADTFVGGYIAMDYMEACEAWGLPPSPDHPIEPRRFDVPALIVTGEVDPVTPPEYGQRNAEHFDEALHIVVPGMAHGDDGMGNAGCLTDILTDFVNRGSLQGLDVSCVETMRPPTFRMQ